MIRALWKNKVRKGPRRHWDSHLLLIMTAWHRRYLSKHFWSTRLSQADMWKEAVPERASVKCKGSTCLGCSREAGELAGQQGLMGEPWKRELEIWGRDGEADLVGNSSRPWQVRPLLSDASALGMLKQCWGVT